MCFRIVKMNLLAIVVVVSALIGISSAAPTLHGRIFERLAGIKSERNLTACAEEWTCAIRVATNVTEVYNLTKQWDVPKSLIEQHVQNMLNQCPSAENVIKCCQLESEAASTVFFDFMLSLPPTFNGTEATFAILIGYVEECFELSDLEPDVINEVEDESVEIPDDVPGEVPGGGDLPVGEPGDEPGDVSGDEPGDEPGDVPDGKPIDEDGDEDGDEPTN